MENRFGEKEQSAGSMSLDEILERIKGIMYTVAPHKITGEITLNSSLTKNFALDSLDILEILIEVQDTMDVDFLGVDIEDWIYPRCAKGSELSITVESICLFVQEHLNLKRVA
jgi:acyl carrier protein